MILVFDDVNVREKFEKELSEAVVYHRLDSEVFGDGVSHEDYVNRMFIGAMRTWKKCWIKVNRI